MGVESAAGSTDTQGVIPPKQPSADHRGLRSTAIKELDARDILTRASGFMGDYDYTLNPYSGCSFGCTYCYAAFFSRSAEQRDGWGSWITVKRNAVERLAGQLRRKPTLLDGKRIYISSVTDPYLPAEREYKLTRSILEVMAHGPPAADVSVSAQPTLFAEAVPEPAAASPAQPRLVIQTRSPDVVRDVDLFRDIEANGGRVRVNMTVTTDDEDVRRAFEPSCPANARRLDAIRAVHKAGVEACVTMTPLLLVRRAEAFAQSLLETGVKKFIVQPFHFARGKFVAATRERAFALMEEKLGCDAASFQRRYIESYEKAQSVLKTRLESAGAELGEGKEGFAPPF